MPGCIGFFAFTILSFALRARRGRLTRRAYLHCRTPPLCQMDTLPLNEAPMMAR